MNNSEFKKIVEAYSPGLVAYIYSICSDLYLSQEIVSESFLRLLDVWENIKNRKSWLYKVSRNLALDKIRSSRRIVFEDISLSEIPEESTPADILETNETALEIAEMLKSLSSDDREILTLKFYCDVKNAEIAKLYNTTETHVAVKILRAKKKLRKEILKRRAI